MADQQQPIPSDSPVVEQQQQQQQPLKDIKPLTGKGKKKETEKKTKTIKKPQTKESKMIAKLKKKIEDRQQKNDEIITDIIEQEKKIVEDAPPTSPSAEQKKDEEEKQEEVTVMEEPEVKAEEEPKESEQIDTNTSAVDEDQNLADKVEKVKQVVTDSTTKQQGGRLLQTQKIQSLKNSSLVRQVMNRQRFERDNDGYAKAKTNDYFQWQNINRMKNSKPTTAAILNTGNQVRGRRNDTGKGKINPNSLLINKRFQ